MNARFVSKIVWCSHYEWRLPKIVGTWVCRWCLPISLFVHTVSEEVFEARPHTSQLLFPTTSDIICGGDQHPSNNVGTAWLEEIDLLRHLHGSSQSHQVRISTTKSSKGWLTSSTRWAGDRCHTVSDWWIPYVDKFSGSFHLRPDQSRDLRYDQVMVSMCTDLTPLRTYMHAQTYALPLHKSRDWTTRCPKPILI